MNLDKLSKPELLTLFSILEGELEARDVVIEALKVSYKLLEELLCKSAAAGAVLIFYPKIYCSLAMVYILFNSSGFISSLGPQMVCSHLYIGISCPN